MLSKPAHRLQYSLVFRKNLRSLVSDYSNIPAQILHIAGELHDRQTHGSIQFTALDKIDQFTKIVVKDMRSNAQTQEFGNVLAERMRAKTGGRRELLGISVRRARRLIQIVRLCRICWSAHEKRRLYGALSCSSLNLHTDPCCLSIVVPLAWAAVNLTQQIDRKKSKFAVGLGFLQKSRDLFEQGKVQPGGPDMSRKENTLALPLLKDP